MTALLVEMEWEFRDAREGAHVFASHAEAEAAALQHRYKSADGREHTPIAFVLPNPQAERERASSRHSLGGNRKPGTGVSPEESFDQLERRGLA